MAELRLTSRIRSYYQYLIGTETEFALENRITNAVFLITAVAMGISVILSLFFVGFTSAILLYGVAAIMEAVLFYFSRFRGAYKAGIVISTLFTYVILGFSYFFRGGVDGPTMFAFLLVFQLVITILPISQHWIWITLNIVVLFALLYIDHQSPGLIKHVYKDATARFVDLAVNYGISIVFAYLIIMALRRSYAKEKKRADERAAAITIQNNKLEQLLREKDKLFSIITHDLRSPLNSIQAYLELLREHDLSPEDKTKMESELLDFTRETSDMLFNTLTWAKSQMQGFEVNIQPVNIDEIINQTLAVQKTIASKKNIRISYQAISKVAACGDKELLRVIIRNLISNAIKFTPRNGAIYIDVQEIRDECRVSVRDTGIGISPDKQTEIFSLKSQSTKGTENEKGIGLGLTICKEFLELQRGRIWVDKETIKGTKFNIALPATCV